MKALVPLTALVALTACSSGTTPVASTAAPADRTATRNAPTESAAPTAPATGASHAPPADVDPCPVSAATLLKALTADIADRSGKPKSLGEVRCYKGYAVARTPYTGVGEQSWILFGYQRPANKWISLNLGTSDYCTGYVLDQDIRKQFPGCG